MSDGLLTAGAAAGAMIAVLILIGMGWRGLSYLVRAHDELLGKDGQCSVRQAVEHVDTKVALLDRDLRDHMEVEANTIGNLRDHMEAAENKGQSQIAHLTNRIEELYDLVLRK